MTSWYLFQITFILRRPRDANCADIIKFATFFFPRQPLKTQKKLKELEIKP